MYHRLKNLVAVAIAVFICLCQALTTQAWIVEPIDLAGDAGWTLSLDIDSAGIPHAAYYASGDFRYTNRSSGSWQQGQLMENADAFALDKNDVRYFTNIEAPAYYPWLNIQMDNGLVLQQQLASHRISSTVFLDFDSQNYPQLGIVDTAAQQLKHMGWNGSDWTTSVIASGSEFQYGNSSFVATLDDNDQVHFAWDDPSGTMQYAKPTGASWQVDSLFASLDTFAYDIDVDSDQNVHLAFENFTGNVFTGGLFYGYYDGNSWSNERVSGLDSFGSPRAKIVADATGEPHIFTFDSPFGGPVDLKHVTLEDGSWENEIIDTFTNASSGPDEIEATIDDDGLHVLYATGNQTIHYAFEEIITLYADFDDDGDVDNDDLTHPSLGWENRFGNDLAGADFLNWQQELGIGAPAIAAATAATIPEPSTLLLLAAAAAAYLPRNLRRRRAVPSNAT